MISLRCTISHSALDFMDFRVEIEESAEKEDDRMGE